MSSSINPKPCNYGCNTQIYWNISENTYFEVFTKKKHICPNRKNKQSTTITTTTSNNTTGISTNKPTYYSKKPWSTTTPKPKMSNSFELLQGSIANIQKRYETLSDVITEYNGKLHGSQRDRDPRTGLIDLLVYYEVPLGMSDKVKQRFNNKNKSVYILDS
jgi:hypothetical protein